MEYVQYACENVDDPYVIYVNFFELVWYFNQQSLIFV